MGELGHSLTGFREHSGGEDSRRGDSTAKRRPELDFSDLRCETEVLGVQGCSREVWGISMELTECKEGQEKSLGPSAGWRR